MAGQGLPTGPARALEGCSAAVGAGENAERGGLQLWPACGYTPWIKGGGMKGITEEFVQRFRESRIEKDWDLWQLRQWMEAEEARLARDNPGLHDYIVGVLAGMRDRLDTRLAPFVCDRLYFHFLELLAIVREHEQIEGLEKLWEQGPEQL
jgi:hypothetical protein